MWYALFGIVLLAGLGALTGRNLFAYLSLGGIASLALIAWVREKVELATDFVPVVATVTGVNASCYLEEWDNRGYRRSRSLYRTAEMSCSKAEFAERNAPLGVNIEGTQKNNTVWDDLHVKGTILVSFRYVAPASNGVRYGTLGYEYRDYKRLMDLRRNGELPILAHRTNAAQVTQDYGRMDAFETR